MPGPGGVPRLAPLHPTQNTAELGLLSLKVSSCLFHARSEKVFVLYTVKPYKIDHIDHLWALP